MNGAPTSGPDLSVEVNGLRLPNPFVIGSGPPGTNYAVMKRAFQEGWGAVIAKTVSLEAGKVINVTPRCVAGRGGGGKRDASATHAHDPAKHARSRLPFACCCCAQVRQNEERGQQGGDWVGEH